MTVRNNYVYRVGNAINMHQNFYNTIENNVFVNSAEQPVRFAARELLDPVLNIKATGSTFRYNVVYNHSGFSYDRWMTYIFATTNLGLTASDNNVFYPEFDTNKPNFNTLAEWQTVYGFDLATVVADPLFTNYASDVFTMQGASPALALGFRSFDVSGNGPRSSTADVDAPTMPANLAIDSVSGTTVNLSWDASIDDTAVSGYRVYDGDTALGTSATASYSAAGLTTGAHTLAVVAYDAAGNESERSYAVTATTTDTAAPALSGGQPSGALNVGTRTVSLRAVTNETATCKWSTTAGQTYDVMVNTFSSTASTTHAHTLSGLQDGVSYLYYVRCQDGAANKNTSDYTVSFSVATVITGNTGSSSGSGNSGGGGGGSGDANATGTPAVAASASALTPEVPKQNRADDTVGGGQSVTPGTLQPRSLAGLAGAELQKIVSEEARSVEIHSEFVPLSKAEVAIYLAVTDGRFTPQTNTSYRFSVAYFIRTGTAATVFLGSGERGGVINSFFSTFERLPTTSLDWEDLIKIANGRWPNQRSDTAENNAKQVFKTIYHRTFSSDNPHDVSAIMIIAYGLRPLDRNLISERNSITTFISVFGHSPTTALDWDIVRAVAYSGAKR